MSKLKYIVSCLMRVTFAGLSVSHCKPSECLRSPAARPPLIAPCPIAALMEFLSSIKLISDGIEVGMKMVSRHFEARCSLKRVDALAELGAEHTPLVPF